MKLFKKKNKSLGILPFRYVKCDESLLMNNGVTFDGLFRKSIHTSVKEKLYRKIQIDDGEKGELIEGNKNKPLPVLYAKKEDCCGCSACFAICPVTSNNDNHKAIEMIADEEGFLYPVVDAEKCIQCYQCLHVCPFKE